MFISKSSLYNARTEAINYISSVTSTITNSAGIIYLAIKENKKRAFITLVSSISYGALSYYEVISQAKMNEDLYGYREVFSLFASAAGDEKYCPVQPVSFGHEYKTCLPAEGELFASLSKGQNALAQYIAISFLKPLLLTIPQYALNFSLSSALIKKWLGNNNNQLGLKILDNEIAMETREIIYLYSSIAVSGVIERVSSIVDILISIAKIHDIYQMGSNLDSEDEDFSLLRLTALAMGAYFISNVLLKIVLKKYAESNLKNEVLFKNDITFNMDNALQVECSRATHHEYRSLMASLAKATKTEVIQDILGRGISTANTIFTNFFTFIILNFSIPFLTRNPALYFQVERFEQLVANLCNSLWGTFVKIYSSSGLDYSSAKVKRFIDLIDFYQTLLENRKSFSMSEDPDANLSCNLTIKYPMNSSDSDSSCRILFNNFTKEFEPGKLYAISGPSGSGKSSFFNALIGINPYATGQVTITTPENIIYVPQEPVFKPNLSWMQTILYPLSEKDHANHALETRISGWVSILGLESVYDDSKTSTGWINNLSGGEAQRLALIQALAKVFLRRKTSPTDKILLLLDEAMNALDPEIQQKTFKLIAKEVKGNNVTALHIDHSDRRIINERYEEGCIIYFDELNKNEE